MSDTRLSSLIERLLQWYGAHRRDLPWRREVSPWRVLVAELMLQQTRVAAVVPRYEAFLERFPDSAALAAADEEEVLALWSGLGYYRRARSLHAAARAVVERHGGRLPADRGALLALPGIGAYTAGAVLSIAFGLPEPILDGNVERVFARIFLLRGDVKRGAVRKRLWELARRVVAGGSPDRVNQALMEFGALVCLPRGARCGDCPLAADCRAYREDRVAEVPARPPPREPVPVTLAVAVVRRDGRVLLCRAPSGGFLAGIWGPPFAVVQKGAEPAAALRAAVRSSHGLDLSVGEALGTVRHAITHHRIRARCYRASIQNGGVVRETAPDPAGPGPRWVPEDEVDTLGLSSLARKALRRGRG